MSVSLSAIWASSKPNQTSFPVNSLHFCMASDTLALSMRARISSICISSNLALGFTSEIEKNDHKTYNVSRRFVCSSKMNLWPPSLVQKIQSVGLNLCWVIIWLSNNSRQSQNPWHSTITDNFNDWVLLFLFSLTVNCFTNLRKFT